MLSIVLMIAGAALLIKGADLLVEGGAGIALKSGVSHLVVGLTVVAFGTSAPELAASLTAAFEGAGGICFGNVVGSNVANIALILGVTAFIKPVSINRQLIKWEMPFMIGITAFTFYIGLGEFVGRLTGLMLLILFGIYLVHCAKSPPVPMEVEDETARKKYNALIVMVILGTAGLGFGGIIFVKGARDIAHALGVSETVIGLTVVALGTSLPELITSLIAARKGHSDISLGNIVGSNIFNILLVLGVTASIRPYDIPYDKYMNTVGMPLMMGLAVLLLIFSLLRNRLARFEGALFSILYVVYCVLAVVMAK